MEFVEWSDSYSVGNALMDAHHQVFFRMIREFSEPIDDDDPDGMMKRVAFLAEYTMMHLDAEEDLMEQAGYPALERHAAVHAAFRQQVESVKDAFFRDQASVAPEHILNMMQGWFVDHILNEDKHYAPHLPRRT